MSHKSQNKLEDRSDLKAQRLARVATTRGRARGSRGLHAGRGEAVGGGRRRKTKRNRRFTPITRGCGPLPSGRQGTLPRFRF